MLKAVFGKYAYRCAIILFAILTCNILVGKISLSWFDQQLPLSLGNVTEFLILFAACIFFVAGILRSENENSQDSTS